MPLPGRRSRMITPIAVPSQRRRGRCDWWWLWWWCNMLFAGLGVLDWFGFLALDRDYKSPLLSRDSLNAFIPSFCLHDSFCFLLFSGCCGSVCEMTATLLWFLTSISLGFNCYCEKLKRRSESYCLSDF
jgi:hypothetical protein